MVFSLSKNRLRRGWVRWRQYGGPYVRASNLHQAPAHRFSPPLDYAEDTVDEIAQITEFGNLSQGE